MFLTNIVELITNTLSWGSSYKQQDIDAIRAETAFWQKSAETYRKLLEDKELETQEENTQLMYIEEDLYFLRKCNIAIFCLGVVILCLTIISL